MKVEKEVGKHFRKLYNHDPQSITPLQGSGSDRKYFRIRSDVKSLIAVFNDNRDENDAFVSLSEVFHRNNLPVPKVYAYYPEKHLYFQSDLGDTNLFTWLQNTRISKNSDKETASMYQLVLYNLVDFQLKTLGELDPGIFYPHKSFDRQSMLWDMNYFKYMFLKLVAIPFNENRLEKDFEVLSNILMEADQDYFLYRDFQSANIMIVDSLPWYIDFQGGRGGAPQYDVASLLYDSKACMGQDLRDQLLNAYLDKFCEESGYDRDKFNELYPAYVIIRIMQAMGAYGFRGLFEKKDGFAQSIAPAVRDLYYIFSSSRFSEELPELWAVTRRLKEKQKVFEQYK